VIKIHESMIQLKVSDGTQMAAFVAKPDGPVQGGILVFQEAFGVNNHIENIARRLAREGYVAIAPELFHRTAPVGFEGAYDNFPALKPHFDALSDETLMADAKAAYEWFRNEAGLKADSIGCVGFCMGGRIAFMVNAAIPMKAAVSFYGSRILTQSLPLAKDQKAPLLLIWAGKDKGTPPEKIKELTDSLKEAGKDFINAEFSEAEHGFNCDDRPAYHPASADVAWAMTLAFFKKHLGIA
jgi:carboxymethylenebutenolidase